MINDYINNLDRYLSEDTSKIILDFISKVNTETTCGRFEIFGSEIYANIEKSNTKPVSMCRPESHLKYADIHMILCGMESISNFQKEDLEIDEEYDEEKDIMFYKNTDKLPCSNCINIPGRFTLVMPDDAHRPMEAIDDSPHPVTKLVIKIKTNYICNR